jgi:nucleoside-diphosphate-sugar epimerase
MRTLVTGGAGFIGSHLVDRLLQDGHEVTVLDDLSTGLEANFEAVRDDIELVVGDIRDPALCREHCRGVDWVFHLAALGSVPRSVEDPITTHEVNITGTLNVLMAARDAGVERVVFSASSAAYGDTEVLPKVEGMAPRPLSPYAVSKIAGEGYCSAFHAVYDLPTVSLRYFNIFGPRQRPDGPYAAVVPKFFDAVTQGQPPTIHGDGGQTRDFTFVSNAVDANLRAAKAGEPAFGRVVNVATGERVSVNRLYRTIAELVGSGLEPLYGPPRPGDVRDSLADVSLAGELLGYEPLVGLEEGLRRMWETLRQ